MAATKDKLKTDFRVDEPKYRLARYLVKMERNKEHPAWKGKSVITDVSTNGELDVEKVKAKFLAQGLCTEGEFDKAAKDLRDDDVIDAVKLEKKGLEIEGATDDIDIEKHEAAVEVAAEHYATELMKLSKEQRDEDKMSALYSDLVREKIAVKEQE